MKKINNYTTQYKIISHSSTEQLHNQNHGKNTTNLRKLSRKLSHKKTLSKDRQEFINNISASGFKQFNL